MIVHSLFIRKIQINIDYLSGELYENDNKLTDKVIIVTGANTGIGNEIARNIRELCCISSEIIQHRSQDAVPIVPYNEIMAECRLGYDNFHSLPALPENLPRDYVIVQYSCPCGEFIAQFPLHRVVLLHLMGRTERLIGSPQMRQYLQILSILQANAIIEIRRRIIKDSDEDEDEDEEESPDR